MTRIRRIEDRLGAGPKWVASAAFALLLLLVAGRTTGLGAFEGGDAWELEAALVPRSELPRAKGTVCRETGVDGERSGRHRTDGLARSLFAAEIQDVTLGPTLSGWSDTLVDPVSRREHAAGLGDQAPRLAGCGDQPRFRISNLPAPVPQAGIDGRLVDVDPEVRWIGATKVKRELRDTDGLTDTDEFTPTDASYDYFSFLPFASRSYRPEPAASGWVTILSEDFEGEFPGDAWDVGDRDNADGQYYWGKRTCRPSDGSYSVWSAGAGDSILGCGDDYRVNTNAWMVYGPFSLSDASAAELIFDWWSETGEDPLFWGASSDAEDYFGKTVSGDSSHWTLQETLDLADLPHAGSLLGEEQVWIAFVFISDGQGTYRGSFIDNVLVRKYVGGGVAELHRVGAPGGESETGRAPEAATMRLGRWLLAAPGERRPSGEMHP